MAKKKEETNSKKNSKNPCDKCIKCCNYVAIELDEPEDNDDWNNIRWYLVHKNVWVFVDHDDSWNIQFNTPCAMLDEKGWCKIYGDRPQICKEYTIDKCEQYGDGNSFKLLFRTLQEFETWFNKGKIIPKDN